MRCITIFLFALVLVSSHAKPKPQITQVYALSNPLYNDIDKVHGLSYSPRYTSPALYTISPEPLPVTLVATGHSSAHPASFPYRPTVYVQPDGVPLSNYGYSLNRYAFGTPTYAIASSPETSYAAAVPSYLALDNYINQGAQSYIIADQGKSGGYATWPYSYRMQDSLLLNDRTAYESAQRAAELAVSRDVVAQQAAAQRAAEQVSAEHVAQQAALQLASQQAAAQRATQQAAANRAAQEAAAAQRAAQQAAANRAVQEAAAQRAAQQAAANRAAEEAAAAQRAAQQAAANRAAQEAAAQRAAQQAAANRAAQEAAAQRAAQQAAANRAAQEAAAQRAAQQAAANRAAQEAAAQDVAVQQVATQHAIAQQEAALHATQQAAINEKAAYESAQRAAAAQYAAQKAAVQYNSATRYTGQNTGSLNGNYNTGIYGLIGYTGNTGYIGGLADRFGSNPYDYSGYGLYYGGYKAANDWNNYNRYGSYYGGPSAGHVGGVTYLHTGPGSFNFQNSAANAYTLRQSQYTGYDGSFDYARSGYLGSCTVTVGKPNRCAEFLLESLLDPSEDPRHTSITFETDNGINVHAEGSLKNAGTDNEVQVITGSYSYVTPDGRHHTVHYVADENGFHARGEDYPLRKRSVAKDLLDVIKSEIDKHEKK